MAPSVAAWDVVKENKWSTLPPSVSVIKFSISESTYPMHFSNKLVSYLFLWFSLYVCHFSATSHLCCCQINISSKCFLMCAAENSKYWLSGENPIWENPSLVLEPICLWRTFLKNENLFLQSISLVANSEKLIQQSQSPHSLKIIFCSIMVEFRNRQICGKTQRRLWIVLNGIKEKKKKEKRKARLYKKRSE